jgi:Secretion system C-terminal sorting domain
MEQFTSSKVSLNINKQKILLLCILFFIFNTHVKAQREFAICDSTEYMLNADTTIIAGRYHLYLKSNNNIQVLQNFSTNDLKNYIRDFDIVKPNLWYTVVGSRYIGGPTFLYKSIDKGLTWNVDTNHYNASNKRLLDFNFLNSINNLQHLRGDTLLMFMHYYESGIMYSTDLGKTWTVWFSNLITHYQGMFECSDKYYIYAFEGDAFRPTMFGFKKELLFRSDSGGRWSNFNNTSYHPRCFDGSDTVNCIFASSSLTRCATFTYFKNKITSICAASGLAEQETANISLYPNPFSSKLYYQGSHVVLSFSLMNVYGQLIWQGTDLSDQDFSTLPQGMYYLQVNTEKQNQTHKLLKE